MRWFFAILYGVSAVLFLGFVGWVITRVLHLDQANYVIGQIIIYDLYAIGVVLAYCAFVGGWHLWEKLTGRMEPAATSANPERGSAEE